MKELTVREFAMIAKAVGIDKAEDIVNAIDFYNDHIEHDSFVDTDCTSTGAHCKSIRG